MIDLFLLLAAVAWTLWATWPPRGDQRRWLLAGLAALWGALMGVGVRRGVQPGFVPWLAALAVVGALLALVVVWSGAQMLGQPRKAEEE